MDATPRLLGLILAAGLLVGCTMGEQEPPEPSTLVSLGDSMTMGIQDAGLTPVGYLNCYPYLVAKQMGQADGFRQPRVNDPGIGVPPYERPLWLENGMVKAQYLDPLTTPLQLQQIVLGRLDWGTLFYDAPYNNLGVNGARLDDLNHATGAASSFSGENFFYDIVLRNLEDPWPNLGGTTAVQQAAARDPEYITLWIGNNDILGYVLDGGEDEDLITPPGTDEYEFKGELRAILDSLTTDTDAQIVLANIPQYLPFGYALDSVFVGGTPMLFNPSTLQPIDFDPDEGEELYIPLHYTGETGETVEHVLLTGAGKYIEQGVGIDPAELSPDQKTQLAALGVTVPTALVPLTADLVFTAEEEALALSTIAGFNAIIVDVAAEYGLPVVDINTWMKPGAAAPPNSPAPAAAWDDCLKFALVSQDNTIFSLDGVHASNYGHAFIANEFIAVMNAEFGLSIPYLDPDDYAGQYSGKALLAPSLKAIRGLKEMYAPAKR